MNPRLKRKDVIYPELSYRIIGAVFDVYNTLGPGYREEYYQKALAERFKELGIIFKREISFPIKFGKKVIGRQRLDFLIDNKVILEMKKSEFFSKRNVEQIYQYLQTLELKLAILVNITPKGVLFRRIVNTK